MKLLTTTLLLAAPVAPAQVVTSNADAGAGSLRAVVAAASPGATITFATGLSGQTIADPVLAPLGNYGGPTLTMPPQFGSPAIDASGAVSASTDQRGLPRLVGAAADIGAVELQAAESFYNPMRNAANSGPYTLRSAIASSPAGTTIAFATNLIGQTITLTTGELLISQSLTIVGPGAASLALSGNNASRVFNVNSGVTLNLAGLTLRNGRAAGGANSGVAGSAGGNGLPGGGIFSAGSFTLTACTITGNGSGNGGGGGFAAFGFGGGGSGSGGGGGGVLNSVATTVACNNTIIALNSAATAPDVSGGFTSAGHNFIGKLDGSTGLGAATDIFGTIAVPANPLLGAIANNGGGTLTLALLPARPALDAGNDALAATLVNDQRGAGFARLRGAHVDIGAYELDLPGFSAPTIVT